jgi:hypothetical protein
MNALDPTVAEFRERLKHQRTEKRRRPNAMNCKPENSLAGLVCHAIFAALLGSIRALMREGLDVGPLPPPSMA